LNNRETTIKEVERSLIEFIQNFCINPFEYFYEEDLRAFLLTKLKSKVNISSEFPTLTYSKEIRKSSVNSSIIKAEYPYYKKFDIAFLSYQKEKDFYNQPVFMAIEIKLGSHKIGMDRTAGFKSDIVKLTECLTTYKNENFIGIALYFCQTLILKKEIDEWYKGISFEQIDVNQLVLSKNNVYAIIVPGEQSEKISLSKIKS